MNIINAFFLLTTSKKKKKKKKIPFLEEQYNMD